MPMICMGSTEIQCSSKTLAKKMQNIFSVMLSGAGKTTLELE